MQHPDVPINFGVPMSPVVMFERGPAFETLPGFKDVLLAKYAKETDPLESGMVIPSEVLHDKISALQLSYSRGRILLYGFKTATTGAGTRYLPGSIQSVVPLRQPAFALRPATPATQEPLAARRRSGGT